MKVGDKLVIINMKGEPQYTGRSGIITSIETDPWGDTAIHGTWGGCSIYTNQDEFEIYPQEEK
jgi:hypothetical protein